MNMMLGKCCSGLTYYKIHMGAAFLILIGVVLSMLSFTQKDRYTVRILSNTNFNLGSYKYSEVWALLPLMSSY